MESTETKRASLATKNQINTSKKARIGPISIFPLSKICCRNVEIETSKIRAKKIFKQTQIMKTLLYLVCLKQMISYKKGNISK